MRVKISEATGIQLDWLVAKCEGLAWVEPSNNPLGFKMANNGWRPSTNWAQGGPIIEREGILNGPSPFPQGEFAAGVGSEWGTCKYIDCGPTPLIAAMRCFVASRLGDEVEVPEELS